MALAHIILLQPPVMIGAEPTSGLDMSVQATVLNLLLELRERFGLTYLFISHDLSVVKRFCDRVAIMYLGRIVELAATVELFATPRHPYTRALLAAVPRLDRGERLTTPPPSPPPLAPPTKGPAPPGCRGLTAATPSRPRRSKASRPMPHGCRRAACSPAAARTSSPAAASASRSWRARRITTWHAGAGA